MCMTAQASAASVRGPQRQMHVRHRRRPGAIRIDHDQLRPALLSRAGDMRHDVDLGGDRIAAPDHDQVGFRHLARIGAAIATHAREPPGLADRGADGQLLARVFHHVAQPVECRRAAPAPSCRRNRTARPLRCRAVRWSPPSPRPRGRAPRPSRSPGTGRSPWGRCATVAGSAGPDDGCARRSATLCRRSRPRCRNCPCAPSHRADPPPVQHLHLQRAGGGAVMRAGGGAQLPACRFL